MISEKEFLESQTCCGEKMVVINEAQVLSMNLNSMSFAICKKCNTQIVVSNYTLDEEEMETLKDTYEELK